MGTARRSSCRRRSQAICILIAVALFACFGLLAVRETVQRSQNAVLDACAELAEPPLGPIPRVLHQVFLDGEQSYQAEAADEKPAFRVEWRDACRQHYSNWEQKLWTQVRSLSSSVIPLFTPSPRNPSLPAFQRNIDTVL